MPDLDLGQPIPDDPRDPVGGDIHPDMTDAEVEAALNAPQGPAADETPIPDEPPLVAADPAVPAEETPEVVAAPILTADERLEALESQIRVERLEREKAEAVAERERYLHSRNAGEVGHLRKLLADRRTEQAAEYAPPEEPGQRPELDEIRSEINALKSERVQQGIAEELSNFQRAYPGAVKDEQDLTVIVQRKLPDYAEFLNGNDPKLARTMVRSLLKESYAELRIEREQAVKTSAVAQSYDQADKMKARKIAAAPAATSRTAPQRARPKTIDDLTDAELEAATDAYVRSSV